MEFLDFPPEVFSLIGNDLSIRDRFYFSITCKRIFQAFNFYNALEGSMASYRLSVEQRELLENLKKSTNKEKIFFKAPPSMGKTVITLSFLLWEGNTNLIIVPPSLIESWIEESKKSFSSLFSSDPLESKILVYHSSYKIHRLYLDNLLKEDKLPQIPLIISSIRLFKSLQKIPYNRIVIDECHRTKISLGSFTYKGSILVSASQSLSKKPKDDKFTTVSTLNKVVQGVVPSYQREFLNSDSNLSTKIKMHEKVVIFLSNTTHYGSFSVEGYRLFHHKQNHRIIEEFNQCNGKAILMSTYRKLSTGHNLIADASFFLDAHYHNHNILLQAESRLLRITNRKKNVLFYYICDNRKIISLRYSIISIDIDRKRDINNRLIWSIGSNRVRSGYITLAFQELGINPAHLTDYEFFYYCHADVKSENLLEFFKEENLINPEIMNKMRPYYEKERDNHFKMINSMRMV